MHPWLSHFPPVPTYGVLAAGGFVVAWLWARRRARAAGLDVSRVDLLMPLLLAAGLAGAWLFGSLTDALTEEAAHGAVLVGSLLAATGAGIGYAVMNRMRLGVLGDVCAAPLAVGIAIGRVGCFCGGCCFGKVSGGGSWLTAVRFPRGSFAWIQQVHEGVLAPESGASLPVYPVQLFESALCLMLAVFLCKGSFGKRSVAGERFLALGIGYAVIRFTLEFLRADNPSIAGLTFSQWNALAIGAIAVTTWVLRRRYAGEWHLGETANFASPVSL